jgi:hypothetical protein
MPTTRLPDSDVYQNRRGQRRPTPLAAGFTRENREGAAECTSTRHTRPSGSSPRLHAVRAIPASNETMHGVVTFDDLLEAQVAAYPGLPRDTLLTSFKALLKHETDLKGSWSFWPKVLVLQFLLER